MPENPLKILLTENIEGDIGALTEMAEGQPPLVGRSLKRKKKPKKLLKGSVSDLTAALGQVCDGVYVMWYLILAD